MFWLRPCWFLMHPVSSPSKIINLPDRSKHLLHEHQRQPRGDERDGDGGNEHDGVQSGFHGLTWSNEWVQ
jgi:hypothetical protein